jgi:hypothetical protein
MKKIDLGVHLMSACGQIEPDAAPQVRETACSNVTKAPRYLGHRVQILEDQ